MKTCDLHTHSVYSDGTNTPKEIIDLAIKAGLSAVALCDHNTVDGNAEFLAYAKGKDILAVSGIEVSTTYCGKELHILGLFVPENSFDDIRKKVEYYDGLKEKSNIELARLLNKGGYRIDYNAMKAQTPKGHINRAHFASELVKMGYAETNKIAFETILKPNGGFYFPPLRFPALEAVEFLKEVGAVPVFAHPFLSADYELINKFISESKPLGLVGIEVYYSEYSEETTALSVELAKKHSLVKSGGSDFHGYNKPHINIGTGKGNLAVPYEAAQNLRKSV